MFVFLCVFVCDCVFCVCLNNAGLDVADLDMEDDMDASSKP